MFSLIMKDILIQKKMVLFATVYILFMMFVFTSINNAVVIFTISLVAVTYMLMLGACALDDKNRADILLNSLPMSRAHIVAAKYLSSYVYMVLGMVYYVIITKLLSMFALPLNIYAISLEGFISAFFAIALLNGLYLPVYFKVGYIKSRIVNFIIFFTFFFGFNALVSLLFNNRENVYVKAAMSFFEKQSYLEIGIVVIGFAVLMMMISFFISVSIYRKREF